jgi:predicted  nucleic acid-binding Zn-ribbon protein
VEQQKKCKKPFSTQRTQFIALERSCEASHKRQVSLESEIAQLTTQLEILKHEQISEMEPRHRIRNVPN